MTPTNSSVAHPRDKWIPWYFVAFFVFIGIVNAIMVTLALDTRTGIVTEHAYEKGLAYNDVVSATAAQDALGWKGEIILADNTLQFILRDAEGKTLTPDTLKATITRPTSEGMDFAATLTEGKAMLTFPQKGLWEIRVFATLGAHQFQQAKRVVVK
jgi:nitrogen fixation protein FixH